MKVTLQVVVKNSSGLHTRPATCIAKFLKSAKSTVFFTCKEQTVDARSAMNLLLLAAAEHSEIQIEIEGEDAEAVGSTLSAIFERGFEEL